MPQSTLVIQSHRNPVPYEFLHACLASVRSWAQVQGFAYELIGDALLQRVPASILQKTRNQPVIATDIGRLLWMQQCLEDGHDAVLWLDADTLVLNGQVLAQTLQRLDTDFAVGRETWVQAVERRPKRYTKVHNAFLLARRGGATLPFYLQTAQRLIARHSGGMPAQFVGPKLLTALHNVAQLTVVEAANVLPPLVAIDYLKGEGPYLESYRAALPTPPASLNLCTSSIARGDLDAAQMGRLIDKLLAAGV